MYNNCARYLCTRITFVGHSEQPRDTFFFGDYHGRLTVVSCPVLLSPGQIRVPSVRALPLSGLSRASALNGVCRRFGFRVSRLQPWSKLKGHSQPPRRVAKSLRRLPATRTWSGSKRKFRPLQSQAGSAGWRFGDARLRGSRQDVKEDRHLKGLLHHRLASSFQFGEEQHVAQYVKSNGTKSGFDFFI